MAFRRARGEGGRRAIYSRDCAAGAEWSAKRHRIRWWTPQGRRDCSVLAGADRQIGVQNFSADHSMKVRLVDIAHARSGDKGDTANVGLIAIEPRWYPLLEMFVTRDAVARHFKGMMTGGVDRFELPNLGALNFLLH